MATLIGTIIWTILSIELTLVFNSVTSVYSIDSTGQLIPFIIGVVGMGKTMNSITVKLIKKLWVRKILREILQLYH